MRSSRPMKYTTQRRSKANGRAGSARGESQGDLFAVLETPPYVPAVTVAESSTARVKGAPLDTVRLPGDVRPSWPLVLSYGMGVDSTAMLVLLWRSGIRPDLILFSDTGGERPETYAYLAIINAWLESVGFPRVTVVRYTPVTADYSTLYDNAFNKRMLVSLAYGGHKHGCSLKFKVGPMDGAVKRWPAAIATWKAHGRVVRIIGYDDSPQDNDRRGRFEDRGGGNLSSDGKFRYWYPLQEAHWDRGECLRRIETAGLAPPPKSACYFCPSTKPHEVIELVLQHPDLAVKVIELEMNAGPRLEMIDGLWGTGSAGSDGGVPKPGSWTEYILSWMIDGRAYQRLPRMGDPGVVPEELARQPNVSRAYRRLLPVFDPDEARVAQLASAGREAALRIRDAIEQKYGQGTADRVIREGHARRERRARLARGRTLVGQLRDNERSLANKPEPVIYAGDHDRAAVKGRQKDDAARARVKAHSAWRRVADRVQEIRQELAPLVEEFGRERLYREKDEREDSIGEDDE